MRVVPYNYSIFFDFIESYLPSGFADIRPDDAIMQKLEEMMEANNQYFSLIQLEEVKFVYTSKGSLPLIGVEPGELNPTHYLEVTHPDDINILEWARIQIFKLEHEIYNSKKGSGLLSYTLRMRNSAGEYHHYLGQDYLFYCAIPKPAVFAIQIGTILDEYKIKKVQFHRYVGHDISLFRFPDEELLKTGLNYSAREIEIIKLVELGLSSEQIADKLFLSIHTVNTHRSNILERSGKATLMDLIYELKDQGLL
jgi:hypothetical protein